MEKTGIQKLAKVLTGLVIITFVCNILALFLVPAIAGLVAGEVKLTEFRELLLLPALTLLAFAYPDEEAFFLAFHLWICGICTAVILWQAKRVLSNILEEYVFCHENADNMKRSAVCCFVISAAALLRLVWNLLYYTSVQTLFTYNTLFIPIFFMGGLVLLVMSALFRQSAEIKAENDMTI